MNGMDADPFAPQQLATASGSATTFLAVPTSPIVEYHATETGLANLRHRLANIVHDCTTTKGMDAARKDRRECVTLRTALEVVREREKKPVLDRGRTLDAEAKRINAEIDALEKPIDEQIKRVERDKADAKAKADKAEADRVALIRKRIDWVRNRPVDMLGKTADELTDAIGVLAGLDINPETYGEFSDEARTVRESAVATLRDLHAARVAGDTEAAALKAERERLDAEKRERDARNAAEDAERATERKRQDDARAFEQSWDDAHREAARRIDDAERAAAKAEQDAAAERERARVREININLDALSDAKVSCVGTDPTSDFIQAEIVKLSAVEITAERFGAMVPEAAALKGSTLRVMHGLLADKLRAEQRARDRKALEGAADPWLAILKILAICDNAKPTPAITDCMHIARDAREARDKLAAMDKGT